LEYYRFSKLILTNNIARKGGGGIHVNGIRKMYLYGDSKITGNKVQAENGDITGSGGGIDFVCPIDDFGEKDCTLGIESTYIADNEAEEGGGIKYHDV
jgi:hypothetical protein